MPPDFKKFRAARKYGYRSGLEVKLSDYLKKLGQEERKILRNLGVKFGRYHIFLF